LRKVALPRALLGAFACGIERRVRLDRNCRVFWDRSRSIQGLVHLWQSLVLVAEGHVRLKLVFRHPRPSKVLLARPTLTLGCLGGGNNSRGHIGLDRRSIYTNGIFEDLRSGLILVVAFQSGPVSEGEDQDCQHVHKREMHRRS
jgi:hypothetical protein